MGEVNKVAEILLSLRKDGQPRDFIKDSEMSNSQLDLSLGLSLGGCYNRKPKEKSFSRPSSLTRVVTPDYNGRKFLSLARSSSLPQGETGGQEKKMMKRNDASRRVLDEQRSGGAGYGKAQEEEEMARDIAEVKKNPAFRRAIERIRADVKLYGNQTSQGGENSTLNRSWNNFQPVVTSKAMGNGKSVQPARTRSVPVAISGTMVTGKPVKPAETDEQKNLSKKIRVPNAGTDEQKNPSKKIRVSNSGMHDIGIQEIMQRMPTVTTTGDGPIGRKIEGVLYKCTQERVKIMCVCHGNFLSPAEFVKHAGGSDVANPMKHINVLPPSL